jgi:hypothetical protein
MDSLKFHLGPPYPTLLHPAGGPPLMAVSEVAHPWSLKLAAVFYPLGHPMPYAYGNS